MRVLFPYPILVGDVELKITDAKVDGLPIPTDLLERERRMVSVNAAERQKWDVATLQIEAVGPQTEIKERIAEGLVPKALAVLHGSATNMRRAALLEADPKNPARWTGKLSIERPYWYGKLVLNCSLVSEVGGATDRIIGVANPWTVALDDLPRPPVKGNIPVLWDDFGNPRDLDELKLFEAEPCFIHLDPDQPVLYLNEAFPGLRPLLEDRRRRERDEQVLHDQTRVTFATEAWGGMFNVALSAAAAASEEDEIAWPDAEWQRSVLEILLDRMYSDQTLSDALHEAVTLFEQGDGVSAVHERLTPAISGQVGAARLLRASITRLESLREEAE